MPHLPPIIPADVSLTLLRDQEKTLDLAESCKDTDPHVALHLAACRHAGELLAVHDSSHPLDAIPRNCAEQLLCLHLLSLSNRLSAKP